MAGDSAGGARSLALALGARELDLPLPAALGLIYPGPDLDAVRPPAPTEPILTLALLDDFAAALDRELADASHSRPGERDAVCGSNVTPSDFRTGAIPERLKRTT